MSRWKNAAPRREHRERSQPAARAKLGLLEKHKDYKERAVAYHRKQDRLQALKLRAAFRNPDEFSFRMVKSQTQVRVSCCAGTCGCGCPWLVVLHRVRHLRGADAGARCGHATRLVCRMACTATLRRWKSCLRMS